VASNTHDYKAMLHFFNLQNDNKFVKEGSKIILDSIHTNLKIYAPMLARKFTLEESHSYDNMTNERFD
jgi:hypothetical protein